MTQFRGDSGEVRKALNFAGFNPNADLEVETNGKVRCITVKGVTGAPSHVIHKFKKTVVSSFGTRFVNSFKKNGVYKVFVNV